MPEIAQEFRMRSPSEVQRRMDLPAALNEPDTNNEAVALRMFVSATLDRPPVFGGRCDASRIWAKVLPVVRHALVPDWSKPVADDRRP